MPTLFRGSVVAVLFIDHLAGGSFSLSLLGVGCVCFSLPLSLLGAGRSSLAIAVIS